MFIKTNESLYKFWQNCRKQYYIIIKIFNILVKHSKYGEWKCRAPMLLGKAAWPSHIGGRLRVFGWGAQTLWLSFPFLGGLQITQVFAGEKRCRNVYSNIVLIISWKQHPPTGEWINELWYHLVLRFHQAARKVEVHVSTWMNHEYKLEQKASCKESVPHKEYATICKVHRLYTSIV